MKVLGVLPVVVALSVAASISTREGDRSQPDLGYNQLLNLTHQFLDRFTYPNNVKEAQSINSTVQGRVSDTRNFEGRELNTEYIFGLFTPSESLTIIGIPVGPYEIVQFVANQNIVSASTRFNFQFPSFGNVSVPIMIDVWFTWNSAKEVSQYDVTFRWFGNLLQKLLLSVDPDPVKAQSTAKAGIAKSICSTHTKYCNGTNTQYESPEECYKFLTEDIRMGESFELGMNTLLCRNVHEIMIKFRPDVHCSHIGKTGGEQCDDTITYQTKVQEKYYTNAAWIPQIHDESPSIDR